MIIIILVVQEFPMIVSDDDEPHIFKDFYIAQKWTGGSWLAQSAEECWAFDCRTGEVRDI